MLFKFVSAAVFAVMTMPTGAISQTIAQIGGPAEQPPAGYSGDQFVDSRGCVFLRAGIAGQARWVPRVSRARTVLCGYPPTFGSKVAIEMADEAPAAPAAVTVAPRVAAAPAAVQPPMETVASAMMPPVVRVAPAAPPARVVTAAPVAPAPQTYEVAASTGPGAGKIGCFSDAPVAEVVRLRNGGTAVVCTRGDGTLAGWRSPIYPNGAGVGAALRDPGVARADTRQAGHVAAAGSYEVASAPAAHGVAPVVPKGYKVAWDDDRLNPNRGKGTAKGQQAQDQVWNRDVPATLVGKTKSSTGSQLIVSTKNAPTAPVQDGGSGRIYVQVGTFGVAANAAGAAQRLQALGLPVAKSRITKGGRVLEIVLAGPFGSTSAAKGALQKARSAGFGDAILR